MVAPFYVILCIESFKNTHFYFIRGSGQNGIFLKKFCNLSKQFASYLSDNEVAHLF